MLPARQCSYASITILSRPVLARDRVGPQNSRFHIIMTVVIDHKLLLDAAQRIADDQNQLHPPQKPYGVVGQGVGGYAWILEPQQPAGGVLTRIPGVVKSHLLSGGHELVLLALAEDRVVLAGSPRGEVDLRVLKQAALHGGGATPPFL